MRDEDGMTVNEARHVGYLEGHAMGLQEGIEAGLQEGTLVALRTLLLRVLHHQFGEIAPGMRSQIAEEDHAEVLSNWVNLSLSSGSIDEFQSRTHS